MSIDFALIIDSIPKLLMGIGLTFQLLFLSGVLGLALAIILLLMRISGRWYLAAPTMVYIYIFRGLAERTLGIDESRRDAIGSDLTQAFRGQRFRQSDNSGLGGNNRRAIFGRTMRAQTTDIDDRTFSIRR